MKRQLNKTEKELEEQGVKRNKKELEMLKENLSYNTELRNNQIRQREFDDKWRNFLREQKDFEDNKIFKMIESEIKIKEETIRSSNKLLKEGTEIRVPSGVN